MKKDRTIKNIKQFFNYFFLSIIGIIWVYPFLWMVSASFKSQPEFLKTDWD